jgi:hypothetical protein
MSRASVNRTPTNVRTYGDLVVSIESGQPWPGVYRGSKYTLRQNGSEVGIYLNYRRLELQGSMPVGLVEALRDIGKSDGTGRGSIRITANRDVLTKIHAANYPNVDEALVDEGWIPVYVGKLSGAIELPNVDNDPDDGTLNPPCVWEGLPFKHGERWTMPVSGGPEWRIKLAQAFQFPSTHDHTDLTRTFRSFRPNGGRFRINEHGHIWMELPNDDVQNSNQLADKIEAWVDDARDRGRNQLLQLIHRRLEATGNGDPKKGQFPIYLGHISKYDRGDIPTPIVTDEAYYVAEAADDR